MDRIKNIFISLATLPFGYFDVGITSNNVMPTVAMRYFIITSLNLKENRDTIWFCPPDNFTSRGSINRDDFSFDLPFDITLDPRYDISTVKADIDDFYYDIINNDTLCVNIDLFIEAEYLSEDITKKEDTLEEEIENEEIEEVRVEDNDVKEDIQVLDEKKEEIMDKIDTGEVKEETRDNDNITASDLFSNLDDSETYTTYYVYIVKEEDTIDKILVKYGITKDAFEDYNDITNIKPGDKVIIPKTSE